MECKKCGCKTEAIYIDDTSSKRNAYVISECNDCGEPNNKFKMKKVALENKDE